MYYGKKPLGRRVFEVINYTLILLVCVVTLFPFLYVLACSFSSDTAILGGDVTLWPVEFQTRAYELVLEYPLIGRSYLNTIAYTVVGTAVNLLLTLLGAYPLSRKDLPGRKGITFFFTFTMLFSGGLIPTFLVVKALGLIDTFWVMILPTAVSTWNLIMMKTFFQATPVSLLEAARIDGSSEWGTLVRIVLPLSIPSIMTIGLFYAVSHWNDYFQAMIYLNTPENYPLQIHLRDIVLQNSMEQQFASMQQGQRQGSEGVKYATIMFATVPILCVYPFIQKYFVKGVMLGSIKE
ncbi:MAG TPA: carbohydrate ABC transporter permease [Candidatus Caccousia avistercoris]|nr:carbohydrate ABC transporter permease [Candidatus Caccousia avistercoris]